MKMTKGTPAQLMEAVKNRIIDLGGTVDDIDSATNTAGIADKVTLIDVEECDKPRKKIRNRSVDECDNVMSAEETYSDPNAILGDPDATYTMSDLKQTFEDLRGSDPVVDAYGSFDEWLKDTKKFLEPVNAASDDAAENVSDDEKDRYIHTLMGDLDSELIDEVDNMDWSTDDSNIIITVSVQEDVHEYTVPFSDLKFDWDSMTDDVDYILDEISADIAEIV